MYPTTPSGVFIFEKNRSITIDTSVRRITPFRFWYLLPQRPPLFMPTSSQERDVLPNNYFEHTSTSRWRGEKKKLQTKHWWRFGKYSVHHHRSAVICANRVYKFGRRFFPIKTRPQNSRGTPPPGTFFIFVRILRLGGLRTRLFVTIYFFSPSKNKTTPFPPNIRPRTRPHPLRFSLCKYRRFCDDSPPYFGGDNKT